MEPRGWVIPAPIPLLIVAAASLSGSPHLVAASAIRSRHDMARNKEMVYSYFPRLHERRSQLACTLSGGEQQMVAMGRALMSRPGCC